MGKRRLEKNGAIVERGAQHPELPMFLHAFPQQHLFVATNPLPNYLDYRFRTPDGVQIVADGACSMGSWAVKDAHEIAIRNYAFGGAYLPAEKEVLLASCLFITGTKDQPKVTLNDKDVTTTLKPWTQEGVNGWLVSLTGAFAKDEEISTRLQKVNAAFAVR